MELWIRSQDRTNLIKVEHVAIVNNYTINAMSTNWDYDIGTYKTKERALEVLDEIQNILKPKYIVDTSSIKEGKSWVENGVILQEYNANARVEQLSTYVYEMPKE